MVLSPRYPEYLDALLMQAALVDDFLPRDLMARVLPAEERGNILLRAHLMSALRENCTVKGETWELRPIARRKVLGSGDRPEALPDTEIGTALKGESIYSSDGLSKLIEDEAEIDTLSLAVSTLEQAGPRAPGHEKLIALSSKLDRMRRDRATDDLLGDDFVGRQQEISELLDVLDRPQRDAPLRTLHVQGLPGVGKTFLLEELSRQCRARPRIVMIRLDFDRSSLSAGAVDAIFDEISRQIGIAMPERASELHRLRLESAARITQALTQPTAQLPFDMLYQMIEMLAEADRQVLFVLDTLEVLHGLGATFVYRLLDDLDRFADKERLEISLISAGRGPIFAPQDKRLRGLILLENLDREVTHAILRKREVPEHLHDRIFDLSKGQPLKLILVSKALADQGADAVLGDKDIRAVSNGYLYRAIMSRVPVNIREIAAEGLILPALGTRELTGIVGPALGMDIDSAEAEKLLELLEMQRWMVRRDRRGDLVLLTEVRREVLELTYAERPEETRRINEYAVDFFRERDPVRALYHLLQLSRNGGEMPAVDPEVGRQLTEELLEDLPAAARDAVLRARGQRSRAGDAPAEESAATAETGWTRLSQAATSSAPSTSLCLRALPDRAGGRLSVVEADGPPTPVDPGGLKDLRNMLEARELREATHLVKQIMRHPFAARGEAGMLAVTHQWLTGHWSMAGAILDLLNPGEIQEVVEADTTLTGLALLELQAEFRFDDLCGQLQDARLRDAAGRALHLAQRNGLRGGALAMALLAVDALPEMPEDLGPIVRHLGGRADRLDRNAASRSAALRREFGLDYTPGRHDPASLGISQYAQLMAPQNPYGEPIRALLDDLSDGPPRKVHRDTIALRDRLTDLARDFVPELEGTAQAQERAGSFAEEIVTLLGAMGLTTEYARGYAFFSPIPDLPTIARGAERWQQATLGRWQFGEHRPDTWQEFGHDSLLFDRIDSLTNSGDRQHAIRTLAVWDDPSTTGPDTEAFALPARLEKTAAEIASLEDPEDQIAVMQAAGVPAVLQPPLIALSHYPHSEEKRAAVRRALPIFIEGSFGMTTHQEAESMIRLETMGNEGLLDKAKATLDTVPPVLAEFGIAPDEAKAMLETPLNQLESSGHRPSQLEAIVRAVGRPPLVIENNTVLGKHTLTDEFPVNMDMLITGTEPLLPNVGRVEFLHHDMSWGGTAWVIDEKADHLLICTNRHVAEIVARRTFRGDGVFMFAPANVPYGAEVDFVEEVGSAPDPERVFPIEKFTYLADDASADVAIGRIRKPAAGDAHQLQPLNLAGETEEGANLDLVAVIGYPARDSLRNDPTQMEQYFRGLYDVKRFAPGFLKVQDGVSILSHDCTTLGGNSGSPVIRLEDRKVVGLHFAGRFAVGNSAVRANTLRAILDGTVPTHVPGHEFAQPERPDGAHDADHFDGRAGYDPDFLQVASVPLPKTPDGIQLSKPTDATDERPHELKYQNFGVLYSGPLKSPILAAMNLDGALTKPQKRGNDKWFSDGRLPAAEQLGKEDYDDPAIDRGHLIRRAATNWGETEAQAKLSNADSFHYTVASPQHMSFNRSHQQWLGLENYIMSHARTHGFRCCVFTGPILTGEELPLKDTGSPIPMHFFKVVTMLAEEEGSLGILRLHATAYVLSQGQLIQRLLMGQGETESTEGFAFGEFKTFQTRIADLEAMSGFDFGPLRAADPLARRLTEMAVEGPAPKPVVTVEGYENIVL